MTERPRDTPSLKGGGGTEEEEGEWRRTHPHTQTKGRRGNRGGGGGMEEDTLSHTD